VIIYFTFFINLFVLFPFCFFIICFLGERIYAIIRFFGPYAIQALFTSKIFLNLDNVALPFLFDNY
jgi:hypothetical protein